MTKIGILHPGKMGISVAASAQKGGHEVYWASEGRSAATHERAATYGLQDCVTVANLCQTCSIIISICPPHAAESVADEVLGHGFTGLYLDGNAISPQLAIRIGAKMADAGVAFVDGSIIGGPAWKANATWLHLSGTEAVRVAACFEGGLLEPNIIGDQVGQASSIKMCYAAYTKGTAALLSAILAGAEKMGVRDALQEQWSNHWPNFTQETTFKVRRVTAKAWRFAGEMEEIAATFDEAGLPNGFQLAAAEVYRRMAGFKDAESLPELDDVIESLLSNK